MLKVQLHKQAGSFLGKIPVKHARQIVSRTDALRADPDMVPSEELKGYAPFRRLKSGEYRVIFFIDAATGTLHIPVIGKRNDDDIYKHIARMRR